MNKFVRSDIAESERILRLLETGEYDSPAFLDVDGDIPFPSTLFSIFTLAPRYGIELVIDHANASAGNDNHRRYQSAVICKRPKLGRSATGAAQSRHKDVASFMAWRNSIRALMTVEELQAEYDKAYWDAVDADNALDPMPDELGYSLGGNGYL